jgi:hypothetical protein
LPHSARVGKPRHAEPHLGQALRPLILDVQKDDFRPFILLVFEVEGRGGQEDRRAVEIARHGRRVRVNKSVAFGRTLRRDPAREFEPACLERHPQSIFGLEPLGEDIGASSHGPSSESSRPASAP